MIRQFGSWEKTFCETCGAEFEITRTEPKVVDGPVVCSDCKMYDRGYKDGYETGLKDHTKGKIDKHVELFPHQAEDYRALSFSTIISDRFFDLF